MSPMYLVHLYLNGGDLVENWWKMVGYSHFWLKTQKNGGKMVENGSKWLQNSPNWLFLGCFYPYFALYLKTFVVGYTFRYIFRYKKGMQFLHAVPKRAGCAQKSRETLFPKNAPRAMKIDEKPVKID